MIRRPAFTLVEVLLSLVILVVLASSLGWAVREMREKTMVLRRASDDLTVCTAIFDLLDASITSSVALDPMSGRAGVRGTAESIDIVARGVLADLDADSSSLAGLTRLRLSFDPQSLAMSVGRSAAADSPDMQTVSQRIERVRFRYHDGQEWTDSFDSGARGRLPVAVEVSVWLTTALQERATPPVDSSALGERTPDEEEAPFEFDGMGAPVRGDIEGESELPQRRPDRFRIFSVLDAPPLDQQTDAMSPAGGRP